MSKQKPSSPPPISISYTRRLETVFEPEGKKNTLVTQNFIQLEIHPGGDCDDAYIELDLAEAKSARDALDAAIRMAEDPFVEARTDEERFQVYLRLTREEGWSLTPSILRRTMDLKGGKAEELLNDAVNKKLLRPMTVHRCTSCGTESEPDILNGEKPEFNCHCGSHEADPTTIYIAVL